MLLCLSYSIQPHSSVFISVVNALPCAKEMIILILTYLIITQYKEIIIQQPYTDYRQPLWHWLVNTSRMTNCWCWSSISCQTAASDNITLTDIINMYYYVLLYFTLESLRRWADNFQWMHPKWSACCLGLFSVQGSLPLLRSDQNQSTKIFFLLHQRPNEWKSFLYINIRRYITGPILYRSVAYLSNCPNT